MLSVSVDMTALIHLRYMFRDANVVHRRRKENPWQLEIQPCCSLVEFREVDDLSSISALGVSVETDYANQSTIHHVPR